MVFFKRSFKKRQDISIKRAEKLDKGIEKTNHIFECVYCCISTCFTLKQIAIKIFLLNILHISKIPRIFAPSNERLKNSFVL